MPKRRADSIKGVIKFIEDHTAPDEFIFDMTGTFFNFLADRPTPTRAICYPHFMSSRDVEQTSRELEMRKPRVVVNSSWAERNFYHHYPELYRYIYATYKPAETFLEYQVLLRRETQTDTSR